MALPRVEDLQDTIERLAPDSSTALDDARMIAERAVGGGDRAVSVLTTLSDTNPRFQPTLPALIHAAAQSADPALALEGIHRVAGQSDAFEWPVAPGDARTLTALFAGSPHLTSRLAAWPEWHPVLRDTLDRDWTRAALRADLTAAIRDAGIDTTEQLRDDWTALRLWHERQLLRIGWADLAGLIGIRRTAAGLAALADVIIDRVASTWFDLLTKRFGPPLQADGQSARWCVIGLGKLGGDELNFRSDVDLMFLYSDDGQSEGGTSGGVSLHEWFTRWGERIVRTIGEVSPAGTLYRVDTRLRPDGSSGVLARSLASYLHYYETRGEVWERQMLIKARPVAGDHALGEEMLHQLEPFVFPRSHSMSPRQEIRRVKSRILAHLNAQGVSPGAEHSESNLKLRRGGLRDIEFIVQCLQLVAGGADRTIRSANTLAAIEQMTARRVLDEDEARKLSDAYRFYRKIEHRLQMSAGHQTFNMPDDPVEKLRLARRMGHEELPGFLDALEGVRSDVIAIYDDVLGPPESPDDVSLLLELPPGAGRACELIEPYGFRDPEQAHRNLRFLAYGHQEAVAPSGPRPAVVRLVPGLLEQLRKSSDPDRGLANFEKLLQALGAVESFSDLLASHPGLLELLVTLCAGSQSLTDTVLRDPALIDWMLYSGVLLKEREIREVKLVLWASVAGLDDEESTYRAIHAFRKRETLRIGLRYLLGLSDDDATGRQLAAVADAIVGELYDRVTGDVYRRRGQPMDAGGNPAGLAILALGKLGSNELNFGSDLDVVFVHSAEGKTTEGRDNIAVFSQVAQRIMGDISDPTGPGMLYEVDARLRPEGRNGPLTLSLESYRRYLETRAGTWERQALTRARIIAGPEPLRTELSQMIDEFVYRLDRGPSPARMIDEIVEMRTRMEEAAREKYGSAVNIKTGRGGLVDAEFVAQLGQMLYGGERSVLRGLDTIEALCHLREHGFLPDGVVETLISGYRTLRNLQISLRIRDDHAHNVLPADEIQREVLARTLGKESVPGLVAYIGDTMEGVRHAYESAIGTYRGNREQDEHAAPA